jgi:hypothetical protein
MSFDKKGYTLKLNDNLFEPLREDSKGEFDAGHGKEIEDGKMNALHSSSALACNFFHYWRYRDVGFIAKVLGFDSVYSVINFEKQHPKPEGIGGIRPHLDVEITGQPVKPIAIESKFTEPYEKKAKSLKEAYITTPNVWGNCNGCEKLAKNIVDKAEIFEYLDAPQLLKHMLGLKTGYGKGNFELCYIWYKIDGEETSKHEEEIKKFKKYINSEFSLHDYTYQSLFEKVKTSSSNAHARFINYLEDRYFKEGSP